MAFQALFSWDMGNGDMTTLMDFPWTRDISHDRTTAEVNDSEAFARLLVAGTIEHVAEIDEFIRNHLDSWEFGRISRVDLAILRISVYPLLYQKDLHPSIVINEAVAISKEFGSDDSYKFINGILDNIKNELGGR